MQLQSRMAAGDGSFTGRLKREDCKRTKHDSAFCDWKILIGPNDWVYHLLRMEGAERYRTQNLPNCTSCAGVYELGIAVPRLKAGREASRLDPDYIIPVYVGKSDNVRTRLQRYGREGAHLDNEIVSGSKRAGLFTETFSRGFYIVYRWAPMNDNKDAERTEARLLDTFDYAWNKGSNGVRRQNDVFRKVEGISRETRLPAFIRKVQLSLEKQKGIRIKACEPLCLENGSDFHDSFKSTDFLPQIFKFGRSQPRIVSVRFGVNGDPDTICGVALGHGSVCIRPPIKGNKRCAEHKGMKINSVHESTSPAEENAPICGFILDSGVPCTRKPFQRNKRCIEHTGRRNGGFISQPTTNNPVVGYRTSSRNDLSSRVDTQHSQIHQSHNIICGVYLNDGNLCTRQPESGRKRCERHKGMRVQEPISIPSVFAGPATKMHRSIDLLSVSYSPTCGATLRNGSLCTRQPASGRKRCEQHKGMRVQEPISIPSVFAGPATKMHWNIDLPSVSYSPTCGATLRNGSFCSRTPSEGNKRCCQHKGRRI